MNSRIHVKYTSILALLLLSTFIPAIAYAAPKGSDGADWHYTNGNSWAQTYSPETQITADNVDALEVKWVFPISPVATKPAGLTSVTTAEGSTTPPLVVDGKVFITTNYLRTYAINAKTGAQVWTNDYVVNGEELMARIPILLGPAAGALAMLNAHQHGITYWEAGNAVMVNGMACDFYGVDADTGETSFWVQDLCVDVPGNLYAYRQGTSNTDGIATYDKGNQFIFVLPGAMHSWIWEGDARHVIMGIDMDTKQILWRIFNFPPQDVPSKDWALQECDIGFFRDIPCSDVAAAAPENLEWDWAFEGETPSPFGGVTANWGGTPVVDEDTGILYTNTGNQGPYTNIGATPGPRLYGSTIMAIDMDEGKRIWWSQPMPRDPYDYDCNWDGILADVPGLGKVYMKGCKEGMLHILDAETGEPVHLIDVIQDQYEWGQVTDAVLTEEYEGQGGIRYHTMDPFSYYDMREMQSPDGSNYCGRPCDLYPNFFNGIFATDMSYDPETGTLYHYAVALQTRLIDSPYPEDGGTTSVTVGIPEVNTTIVARDVVTGDVKWTWYYDLGQQRSHLTITKDLVYSAFIDGTVKFFDKETGELLREIMLGPSLSIGMTTGQDSDGDQKIFTIIGQGSGFGGMPGNVIALGLSDRAAGEAKTTTVTSTVRTTVTSSTISTVTSATTTTATTSVTSTVTATGPTQTTTVTSEVTEEVGMPAEVTYAAIAVAVIAIVAAAVLMMRKK